MACRYHYNLRMGNDEIGYIARQDGESAVQIKIPDVNTLNFVREISPSDWMMRADRTQDWYFQRGHGAMSLVAFECQRARMVPTSILDFGCGHGCVARMLKAFFPRARLVGQDVNPEWMDWCAQTLGIETIVSAPTIEEVTFEEGQYDVIWAGSVFSHIPEAAARHLLQQFRRALTDRGIVLFSTAGQIMRNSYRPEIMHNVSEEQIAEMCAAFDRGDYAFGSYDVSLYASWGHSLTPWQWMFARANEFKMPICGFYEAGWGLVQDVFAMRKEPNPVSWI